MYLFKSIDGIVIDLVNTYTWIRSQIFRAELTLPCMIRFTKILLIYFFAIYIYDKQYTKENKIYNHHVHWKYM